MCLNVKKTKFINFNRLSTSPNIELHINNIKLERVENFNFLGLLINERLDWSPHVRVISKKLSRAIGIMSRLKSFIPKQVMKTIYYAIFHPHINYHILAWGSKSDHLFLLQKKAIRIMNNEHFLQHTDPLFKQSNILKTHHLYELAQVKFYYKHLSNQLPPYLQSIPFLRNNSYHSYDTRTSDNLRPPNTKTDYSRTTIRNNIPNLINTLSPQISFQNDAISSLSNEFKKVTIMSYSNVCTDTECWACDRVASGRSVCGAEPHTVAAAAAAGL